MARRPRAGEGEYDLLVAGAGPAGLAASLAALQHGLRCRTVEQEAPGGAVRHYPRQKLVMTEPMEIPLYGRVPWRQASKEQLLALWDEVMQRTGLQVCTGERLLSARRDGPTLVVRTTAGEFRARHLLLAIGRRGTPNRLGVPGEDLAKVAYHLIEPEHYEDQRIMVVGGGNTALEVACALSRPQRRNRVTLVHRGDSFGRARPQNQALVEQLAADGHLTVRLGCQVECIHPEHVDLIAGTTPEPVANDQVFVCVGGSLPVALLNELGVAIERKFGEV
jgi:thioredoxin reductase